MTSGEGEVKVQMKKIVIAATALLSASLVFVGIALAEVSPHQETFGSTPDACAACHRGHLGADGNLIGLSSNSLCLACHDGTGADKTASTHSNEGLVPPQDDFSLECTDCHNPHGYLANLSHVRQEINGQDIFFTSLTGPNSFDEDSGDSDETDDVCVTCHIGETSMGHIGGLHSGVEGDQRGNDCTSCHSHNDGFMP